MLAGVGVGKLGDWWRQVLFAWRRSLLARRVGSLLPGASSAPQSRAVWVWEDSTGKQRLGNETGCFSRHKLRADTKTNFLRQQRPLLLPPPLSIVVDIKQTFRIAYIIEMENLPHFCPSGMMVIHPLVCILSR